MEWDAENRLTAAKQGAATLASFVYDGNGRRYQKIAGGVTRTYIHDGDEVAEERLSTGGTIKYFQGPGIDQHLGSQDQSGVATFYAADHLGGVRQTTNSSGTVTLTRDYDPYGNPLAGGSSAGYAFTGREWDLETNLYYYRARYYEARTARFMSEDPAGFAAGTNKYAYVLGNPVRFTDPEGLSTTPWPPGPLPCPDLPPECLPGKCYLTKGDRCYVVRLFHNCRAYRQEVPCFERDANPYVQYCTLDWWRRHAPHLPWPNPPVPPSPGPPPGCDEPPCVT